MNTTYFTTPIGQLCFHYTTINQTSALIYKINFEETTQKNPHVVSKGQSIIAHSLSQYFEGSSSTWNHMKVSFPKGTDFQQRVWLEICKVPYGQTKTYAEIAYNIGKPKAYRAVANACGKNPILLLIPCHRIVSSTDGFGGYVGGRERKRYLLNLEKKFANHR